MAPTRVAVVLAALLGLPVVQSAAQDFPTRPVKIIVPNPPGSGTDLLRGSSPIS